MTAETMTVQWGPVSHEKREIVDRDVKFIGAPAIRYVRREGNYPVEGQPYNVNFRFVRHGGDPWRATVTIYALRPGLSFGDSFTPDKVVDMPEWLADLIAEATPTN